MIPAESGNGDTAKMKLLLIDPPFKSLAGMFSFYFPLGLTYLAATAKQAGFDCGILDMDAAEPRSGSLDNAREYDQYGAYLQALKNLDHPTWDLMRTLILDQKPDFIGITALTTKFGSVIQTARICKEILPQVPVIVGGAHASAMPELTMKVSDIDYVLRGEADESLPELLLSLRDGGALENVAGLSYRDADGKIRHNVDRVFVKDLDSLPLPDRSALLHPQHYSSEDMGVLLTSRGCPYRCSYCFHMWDFKVRYRSTNKVLEEIRHIHNTYGTRQFSLKDDSFTVNRQRVLELCRALKQEPFKIGFNCTTRVDILDDELVTAMKQAGCNQINVGIESGSARILAATDKNITHAQVLTAASLLNRHNLFWSGYFMIGLPEETEQDIRKTMAFLGKARPFYGGLGVYNPFPRTKLFTQGVQLGLLDPEPPLQHFLITNPKDLFFKHPQRRMLHIEPQRFRTLVDEVQQLFQRHNTNLFNMIRRGFARRRAYMHDTALLRRDIGKALEFLGIR